MLTLSHLAANIVTLNTMSFFRLGFISLKMNEKEAERPLFKETFSLEELFNYKKGEGSNPVSSTWKRRKEHVGLCP